MAQLVGKLWTDIKVTSKQALLLMAIDLAALDNCLYVYINSRSHHAGVRASPARHSGPAHEDSFGWRGRGRRRGMQAQTRMSCHDRHCASMLLA
jgi:hypothetical protein